MSFVMRYMCECVLFFSIKCGMRVVIDQCVAQAVQPVDQVNPSSRRGTTACDWAGVAGTAGPYPDEACQGIQAYLAGDGEVGEVALGPHWANPHAGPAWACKVGHKLPSCLWEEGEESTTNSCISYMQLTLNMHYSTTTAQKASFHTLTPRHEQLKLLHAWSAFTHIKKKKRCLWSFRLLILYIWWEQKLYVWYNNGLKGTVQNF